MLKWLRMATSGRYRHGPESLNRKLSAANIGARGQDVALLIGSFAWERRPWG